MIMYPKQNEIFAKRLKNARLMKGFSMEKLSEATGKVVSKMSISKYERALSMPNSTTLIALSHALDQPVDYFFRPSISHIESIRFRKKSALGVKEENKIKENIADWIDRYLEIEEICGEESKLKDIFKKEKIKDASQIKDSAKKLRKEWNLGSDGIVNIINLLEEHGVKIIEIEAHNAFDGMSTFINDKIPVIVLNKGFLSERKRFTALHELAHLIFDFEKNIHPKEEEKLCNLFANEMLILEEVFKKLVGEKRNDISYQELKALQAQYGISCDAMMYKAKECGIIKESRYKSYCIQKNKRPDFKEKVEQSLFQEKESNRFRILVYKALSKEMISLSKAAALLKQNLQEVRSELTLL